MSLSLDGTAAERIEARVRGVAWLVALEFVSGTQRFTTAPVDVVSGGYTWQGMGELSSVSAVQESADSIAARMTIGLSAVNEAMLAAAIGNVDTYRGRSARLYLQLFDEAFLPVGAAVQRWSGYMDKVQITRQRSDGGGGESVGRINLVCSRAGMARARQYQGLRLTDAQQQQRYPGDTGVRYVQTLLEAPSLWLSKRFQEQ
jgi:hypothetical protein